VFFLPAGTVATAGFGAALATLATGMVVLACGAALLTLATFAAGTAFAVDATLAAFATGIAVAGGEALVKTGILVTTGVFATTTACFTTGADAVATGVVPHARAAISGRVLERIVQKSLSAALALQVASPWQPSAILSWKTFDFETCCVKCAMS